MTAEYRLYSCPTAAAAGPPARPLPADRATALLAQRHRSRAVLATHRDLIGDFGWDILLRLFVAGHHHGGMSIDRLVEEIDTPRMILVRWVDARSRRDWRRG